MVDLKLLAFWERSIWKYHHPNFVKSFYLGICFSFFLKKVGFGDKLNIKLETLIESSYLLSGFPNSVSLSKSLYGMSSRPEADDIHSLQCPYEASAKD